MVNEGIKLSLCMVGNIEPMRKDRTVLDGGVTL